MELFTAALLIVILYMLYYIKADMDKKIDDLESHIINLKGMLKKVLDERAAAPVAPKPAVPDVPKPPVQETPRPAVIPSPKISPTEEVKPTPKTGDNKPATPTETGKATEIANIITQPPVYYEPKKSFFERYPDLEKFIGENLVNKIGIAILVLAIGYFVKYAIDNNWIGPVGRVGIGILCGSILIGFAHKLRKNYHAFSSVLAGGGLAVYYFTITLAFHQFNLFNQTVAFIILICITLFAVALALLYDKQELAIIALVGGMGSPFMVSNGHSNFNAFFMYLVILNAGLLIIAYYKAWRILNISAFALTALVYITVLFNLPTANDGTALIYGSVFYLLFLAINIAHNVKEGKAFIASDYSILLINTALYFSAGLYLLSDMGQADYRGLFSAALGAVNLVLSYILFRNKKVDTNILYLLIGITLTFVSLTAPIQLHGNNITLFWAAETVLLYWLFQRSGIKLMKITAMLVWVFMFISLVMDWSAVYGDHSILTVLANKGFITTLCAAISSYLLYLLAKKDTQTLLLPLISVHTGKVVFRTSAFVLLFLSGLFEVNHQFITHFPYASLNITYIVLYTAVFVWLLNRFVLQKGTAGNDPNVGVALIAGAITVYFVFISDVFSLERQMVERHTPPGIHFAAHWVAAVAIGLLFYKLINMLRYKITAPDAVNWLICAAVVAFLSFEVSLLSNWLFTSAAYPFERVETVYIKTGLPVLWGLSSFAMMWLGMRHRHRTLRVISLSLFTLTLLKLFIFDIRDIPAAGKIVAFFCLGVLLLIVSFMYQKVKKIIVTDEGTEQSTEA
ncbi:DUF2339 domain-containing protein [Mucilaginibacter mali]|uniref:DUF2339 domain-containing protein n=1 Tax=Mucilaginibacter mali TaxID=2740462 RepID=A0A7D4QNB3_9SPHI|nr:DUF2339 domain-containing protein [Mucilaginibacter mali]QKJ32370.1 DUF2339 domain-containing protein [Mucilaginibacter mali]